MVFQLNISVKKKYFCSLKSVRRGSKVAQSVKQPTSAQVLISWFMSCSLTLDSLLSAWSPLWILCPLLCLSVSLFTKNIKKYVKSVWRPGWYFFPYCFQCISCRINSEKMKLSIPISSHGINQEPGDLCDFSRNLCTFGEKALGSITFSNKSSCHS